MKKNSTKITIFFIIIIIILVAGYAFLANREKVKQEETVMTPVQEVLCRNMKNDYPATPKEVVKYYNELLLCFYDEESTEEDIEKLGERARTLYDPKLLEQNQLESYRNKLQLDIQAYRDKDRQITSAAVAASTSVVYDEIDGESFARIFSGYTVKEGNTHYPLKQVYLLRRDKDKRWKIYGWENASKVVD